MIDSDFYGYPGPSIDVRVKLIANGYCNILLIVRLSISISIWGA